MLISFSISNFLSFKQERNFSMAASSISEHKESIIIRANGKFLRSAVLYGANSSGKTNFISALSRMRNVILSSVRLNERDKLQYSPFLLSDSPGGEPTRFEMEFMIDEETSFRYGFSYTETKIIEEWLFSQVKNRTEIPLFIRDEEGIAVSDSFPEGVGKEELTNDNRLFLSLVAQLNGKTAQKVIEWFQNYEVISGLDQHDYLDDSLKMIQNESIGYKEALSLFRNMKLGFQNIFVEENAQRKTSQYAIKTTHNKYGNNGEVVGVVVFDKEEQESAGSNKIIDLSGPLFTTLINGGLMVVDELDAKLHPKLLRYVISLFKNKNVNKKGAQLLFTSHDMTTMKNTVFRRDEIWFAAENERHESEIYSLYEIRRENNERVNSTAAYDKQYLEGRYGADPYLTNMLAGGEWQLF